jgi:multicomponent Na+:H+ antiporter subunit E
MTKFKNGLVLLLVLLVFWVLINNSFQAEILLPGIIISLVIAIIGAQKLRIFNGLKLTPKALVFTLVYIIVFLKELIVSNIDVAFRVVSPKLPINPGIVQAKTKLQSPMARMILANSITLTPGTFTVEMKEDTLFIHCLNIKSENTEEVTNKVVRKFEKYLEVMYG